MPIKRLVALILILMVFGPALMAEQTADLYQINPTALFFYQPTPLATKPNPKPYNLEKNKGPGYFTARFFIITGGSFAFTFGLSSAIVVPVTPHWNTDRQIKTSLISAASVSASIGLTDLIIGLVLKSKENRKQKELRNTLNE